MNLQTEEYSKANSIWPSGGRHILAHQQGDELVVYQAYQPAIADWAVQNQKLGGPAFSYQRMSWIKPNFLWMMYRCGWCTKENQERVLALWLSKTSFNELLSQAVHSSFHRALHSSQAEWKTALAQSEVRLQWDPDHDPFGNALHRRAVQVGLRGNALKAFGQRHVVRIEDITSFVKAQKMVLEQFGKDHLVVPRERVYQLEDQRLRNIVGVDDLNG